MHGQFCKLHPSTSHCIKIGKDNPYRRHLLSYSVATTCNMVVRKVNKPSRDVFVQCDKQYSSDSGPPLPHFCLPNLCHRRAKSQIPAERDPKCCIVLGPALHTGESLHRGLLKFLEYLLGSTWSALWLFVFSLFFLCAICLLERKKEIKHSVFCAILFKFPFWNRSSEMS